jgi:hypothetical protein
MLIDAVIDGKRSMRFGSCGRRSCGKIDGPVAADTPADEFEDCDDAEDGGDDRHE